MNLAMRSSILLFSAFLTLSGCAPRALFFHESTKVAFAADYNLSDSQPLATSFGYKRRIVAVVPAQIRKVAPGESERTGTNAGEALSLVSKFNVRAGTSEGIVITNNFASGVAARIMTDKVGAAAVGALMHSPPITVHADTGMTLETNEPVSKAVDEQIARIKSKEVSGADAPPSSGTAPKRPKKPANGPPASSGDAPKNENGGPPASTGEAPKRESAGPPASSGEAPVQTEKQR
jgi:hypothetical protein